MNARKFLRVEIVPTHETHLMCVACGRFNVEFEIAVGSDEPQAGIHKKCIARVKAKRGVK